jgi:hypothetical protein
VRSRKPGSETVPCGTVSDPQRCDASPELIGHEAFRASRPLVDDMETFVLEASELSSRNGKRASAL